MAAMPCANARMHSRNVALCSEAGPQRSALELTCHTRRSLSPRGICRASSRRAGAVTISFHSGYRLIAMSIMDWASRIFSHVLPVSNSRTRMASGTVMPPSLLRHRQ